MILALFFSLYFSEKRRFFSCVLVMLKHPFCYQETMFLLSENTVFVIGKHRFPAQKTLFSAVENAFLDDFANTAIAIPIHLISGGSSGSKVAANFYYLPPFNQLKIKQFCSIGGRVAAKMPKNIFFEDFIIPNILSDTSSFCFS